VKRRNNGQHGLVCSWDLADGDMYLTWLRIGLGLIRPVHDNIIVDGGSGDGTVESEYFIVKRLNSEPRWVLLVMRERLLESLELGMNIFLNRRLLTPNAVTRTRYASLSTLLSNAVGTTGIVSIWWDDALDITFENIRTSRPGPVITYDPGSIK